MTFIPLAQLRADSRAADHPVAVHAGRTVHWRQLLADVAATQRALVAQPARRWALYCGESYPFTVALLALLGLDRSVYLPANSTAGVAAQLAACDVAWIGEWPDAVPVALDGSGSELPQLPPRGKLVIFTSGSSGEPKPIAKQLRQLDAELAAHEMLWGELLRDTHTLATVSHQHIYGLLFKVLGPLCGGRVAHSALYRDPANLLEAAARLPRAAWIASPAHLQRLDAGWPWAAVRGRLAAVFCSGGPLDAAGAAACGELAGIRPIEVYGSSETGGIAWRQQTPADATWTALPGVRLDRDPAGALRLRSPHLADDGWHTTADAAELLADGRFRLRGRLDRIVKIEGKRLALAELEQALRSHPWIADCRALVVARRRQRVAVVAVPSAAGTAALAAQPQHAVTAALRRHLAQQFEPVALPRLWRFPAALPMDAQGKVPQAALQALFDPPPPANLPQLLGETGTADSYELRLRVPADLPCLAGHFPAAPVVPGAVLVGWAEFFGRSRLGLEAPLQGLENVKFKRPVLPGAELVLRLRSRNDRLQFELSSADGEHAAGRLLLAVGGDD